MINKQDIISSFISPSGWEMGLTEKLVFIRQGNDTKPYQPYDLKVVLIEKISRFEFSTRIDPSWFFYGVFFFIINAYFGFSLGYVTEIEQSCKTSYWIIENCVDIENSAFSFKEFLLKNFGIWLLIILSAVSLLSYKQVFKVIGDDGEDYTIQIKSKEDCAEFFSKLHTLRTANKL
jgi:hypothetical protein